MTTFSSANAIVAAMRADESLKRQAEFILSRRYSMEKEKFESLLWHVMANAACYGAKAALKEDTP